MTGAVAGALARAGRPLLSLLSMAFARLELRAKHEASGLCRNYAAVAVKPA